MRSSRPPGGTDPGGPTSSCPHLGDTSTAAEAVTPEGCQDCLATDGRWVHLRLCTACGHVGRCDSSPGKHATAHNHSTSHPVVRSFEPGETRRWCYVDEAVAAR